MDPDQEAVLINKLKTGDISAFETIYSYFRPKIFAYLLRLSQRVDVAEDLSSEVWCRVAEKAVGLKDNSRLAPWLFTIARNLFLSYCRWRNIDSYRTAEFGRLYVNRSGENFPMDSALKNERQRLLELNLARLPQKYREVLILVGIEGLSTEQAAEICQVKPAALRKRISRAKMMLKQKLAGDTGGIIEKRGGEQDE